MVEWEGLVSMAIIQTLYTHSIDVCWSFNNNNNNNNNKLYLRVK